jgi:hypothetical protein
MRLAKAFAPADDTRPSNPIGQLALLLAWFVCTCIHSSESVATNFNVKTILNSRQIL